MRNKRTYLNALNFDVELDEKQLKQATNAVYFLSGALVLSALILKRGKKKGK